MPTTLNVAAVDVVHPGWHQGSPDLLSEQALLTALHEELGCVATLMCIGTPHYSISEFEILARVVDGRTAAAGVEVYASTSREIAEHVEQAPELAPVLAFGANIVVDTCTYLAPVVRETTGAIVTNSGKWAHYGPSNLRRRVGLMSLEDCVRSAETGRVVAT